MKRISAILLVLTFVLATGLSQAQDSETPLLPADLMALVPDENGVVQVARFSGMDGSMEMLTASETNVEGFDALDGDLAYVTEEAVYLNGALVQHHAGSPNRAASVRLNPHQNELVYADNSGLYAIDLDSGESNLLIESTADETNRDPDTYRYYQAAVFTPDPDMLIISVGVWEAEYKAIFDRSTGTLTDLTFELDDGIFGKFNRVVALSDRRVLVYRVPEYGTCDPCGLWIAPSFEAILDYQSVVSIETLHDFYPDSASFDPVINDVVELGTGIVRMLVTEVVRVNDTDSNVVQLVVDVNLTDGTLRPVIEPLVELGRGINFAAVLYEPFLSPDGEYLVGQGEVDDASGAWGIIAIDLGTEERLVIAELPHAMDGLRMVSQ